MATLVFIGTAAAPAASSAAADPAGWTVYHHDASGSGVTGSVAAVDSTRPRWTSTVLDGQLYGEPLVAGGRVYVATENDTVYALSALNGAVVWENHLGTPVTASSLPCGNIQPTVGITGTPVIDESRGELFAVADEVVNGRSAHVLIGLSVASGKTEMTQDVDPGGVNTNALLQRTGLTSTPRRWCSGWAATTETAPPTGEGWWPSASRGARPWTSRWMPGPARARGPSGWEAGRPPWTAAATSGSVSATDR
jgi:outer membrane protein assembly factor BamB